MSSLAIACVVLGVFAIVFRGPLIVAPERTLEFYRRVIMSGPGLLTFGVILGAAGVWLIAVGWRAESTAAGITLGLGGLLVVGAVVLLILPGFYRRMAESVLDSVADPTVLRVFGVLGVAIGVGLIYLGLRVV